MVKKSLLSLAIAASVAGLTGCQISSVENNNQVDSNPVTAGQPGSTPARVAPIFSAANRQLPLNIDLLFADAGSTDGTANVGEPSNAVTQGINQLPGFSTTAAFYIPFNAALDPATVAAGSSVFLVKLKNADDDASIDPLDLESIVAAFPASPVADGQTDQNQAAFDADYVEMTDGTHAIRIMPNEPLEPRTKYIAVVTDAVKGANGEATGPSAEYELLSGNLGLPSSALARVRKAVQGWEQIAGGFLAKATDGVYTQDNVILSYAFTTNSDAYGLKQYAAPGLFLNQQLSVAEAEGLTDAAFNAELPDGTSALTDVVARTVYLATQGNSSPGYADLAGVPAPAVTAIKENAAYEPNLYGAILGSEALPGITINDAIRTPAPRTVTLINPVNVDNQFDLADDTIDNDSLGASPKGLGLSATDDFTRYFQGQIELPNFLALPELTGAFDPQDPAAAAAAISKAMEDDAEWSANLAVGGILDTTAGNAAGTTPPKDCADPQDSGEVDENNEAIFNCDGQADATTNVTWRYPFPQPVATNQGVNYAPLMVTVPAAIDYSAGGSNPAGSDCSALTETPVVMFVHGITSSRGASAGFGAAMAANCVTTVAIDLPVHGIAPTSSDSNGETVDNALLSLHVDPNFAADTASPWAGVAAASGATFANLQERHGNRYADDNNIRQPMVYDGERIDSSNPGAKVAGDSGSTFINLSNFARTRDNMQQAVVDLLNLNASLQNISDELVDAGKLPLDLDKVYVAGHSLGAILSTTYVAVNNDPSVQAYNSNLNPVQGLVLANGGSHVSKLLENSVAFGPTILNGLKAGADLDQGSSDFESFMHVIQASIDVADPANAAKELADADLPLLVFNAVGGGALPVDRSGISLPDGFLAGTQSVFVPDHVVPNFDYFSKDQDANPFGVFTALNALPPFKNETTTATAPMAGTNGLAGIMGLETVNAATTATDLETPTQVVVRLNKATHSTFAAADVEDSFNEMARQTVLFINGAYNTGLNAFNTDVLESN